MGLKVEFVGNGCESRGSVQRTWLVGLGTSAGKPSTEAGDRAAAAATTAATMAAEAAAPTNTHCTRSQFAARFFFFSSSACMSSWPCNFDWQASMNPRQSLALAEGKSGR